jgi:hypothetical protein
MYHRNMPLRAGVSYRWETPTKDGNIMKKLIVATAFAALFATAPAIAADMSTDNQPSSPTSSGPGVKGAPGGTNGPSAKPDSSGNGASTGTNGTSTDQGMSPSQDATGVPGARDSTNGPSDKKPGDTSK